MALSKPGVWWYGDSRADIRDELARYGKLNGYVPTQFADSKCVCGHNLFHLNLDENEGAVVRTCSRCGVEHAMGDSAEYLQDAKLEEVACACAEEIFEITAGVSLYGASDDVRWIYIGCRCPACGLTACYGDWKNEFLDYRKLLANV